ncbi:MAG: hypothetical protein KZQ58_05515 [gamma proteobacterium symbiont of Bathyaustriella thionipta]|nr:hypothetical protein [gamma proteobacterium symbiont of Bathyaustriella thionipta]
MNDPRYINTDLEIDSKNDLTPVVKAFREDVFLMYNGEWGKYFRASFEVNESLADINGAPGMFCMLVEALPPEARKLWDSSFSKTFSLGFESGNSEAKLELKIEPALVQRVGALGGSISIVIYPPYEKDT